MNHSITDPELKKLLDCGIIAIDKPQGPSSHQVTAWVKEILGGDIKIGHGGTLDPMVSGVLIIMLGRAVRLAPVILKHRKEYIAVLRLHDDVSKEDVLRAADEFTGRIYQRPPRKSAVRRQLRIRRIYEIEILDFKERLVLMRVACEAGTYVRSLCTHMALSMGVGGQMEELRRSRSGSVVLSDTCTLHDLKDAAVFASEGDTEELKKMILPVERLISEIPIVKILDSAVEAVCSGALLAGVGVSARESYKRDARVAVITEKGELVCIGKALVSSEEYKPGDTGLVVAPQAVVMKRGTYEKGWVSKNSKKYKNSKKSYDEGSNSSLKDSKLTHNETSEPIDTSKKVIDQNLSSGRGFNRRNKQDNRPFKRITRAEKQRADTKSAEKKRTGKISKTKTIPDNAVPKVRSGFQPYKKNKK